MKSFIKTLCFGLVLALFPLTVYAAVSIPFTVNLSEIVNVDITGGVPRIQMDVGGVTRYATYTSGSGTAALTFTYDATIGDVDLDGVTLTSPIQLNGGTMKDSVGNDATLTFALPNTSGVKVNYPSLGMDFVYDADGRYTLNGTAYNDISSFLTATGGTFSRASIGTYYDSTGTLQTATANTPRFDHDPVTYAPKGILIEESRTNLLTRSSEFENAAWLKNNAQSVTANVISSPDGTLSAELLTSNAPNAYLYKVFAASPNTNYTFTLWVKSSGTAATLDLDIYFNAGAAWFGHTSFTTSSQWQRVSVTGNTGVLSAPFWITIGGNATFSTGESLYVWGAQLEQGSFPTSYIPTTIAAVTRNGDTLSLSPSGWFNNLQGTWTAFFQGGRESTQGFYGRVISFNAGNVFLSTEGGVTSTLGTWSGGSPSLQKGTGIDYWTTGGGAGMSYNSSSLARSLTGRGQAVSTGAYVNSYTPAGSIGMGSNPGAPTNSLNGTISKAKYYPLRVSDTQLQLMTQ